MNDNYEHQYLMWLSTTASEEELKEEINKIIDLENNGDVINRILDSLFEEIKTIDLLMKSENDEEEIIYLNNNKIEIESKINLLKKLLEKYNKKQQYEEYLENFGASGVLFATNEYGNFIIENDLKWLYNNVDESTYNSFIELIEELVSGENDFNITKQKPLSENKKLKGLYEKKNYQARVIYRYVKDKIVIVGALLKKEDNELKDRNFWINCKVKSQNYVDKIENNCVDINEAIEESKKFYNDKILQGESKYGK